MIDKRELSGLPMRALEDIPNPSPNAKEIVGLVKDGGKITGYQLSDQRMVNKEDGVQLARQGEIRGVGIATNRGTEYLKSLPDGTENNNLGNLPSVTSKE